MVTAPDLDTALQMSHFLQHLEIRDDDDLERMAQYAEKLDGLIREGQRELSSLNDYIIERITRYEDQQEMPQVSGKAILRFLMDQHNHKLKDMTGVAPMSVISEILNGKRELNKGQIERLAAKYAVSPAVFF
jgi:HTH-type transcriptional regulator/antitoxin HigA